MAERRNKIVVSFYDEDLQRVNEKIDGEITSRSIREYFGLSATGKRAGKNTLIRKALSEKLKTASDEEKQAFLEQFGVFEKSEQQTKKKKKK